MANKTRKFLSKNIKFIVKIYLSIIEKSLNITVEVLLKMEIAYLVLLEISTVSTNRKKYLYLADINKISDLVLT